MGSQPHKYTIAHILKHISNDCQKKYVGRWYGYMSPDDMLEPPENILRHFINVYWTKVRKKEKQPRVKRQT